MEYLQWAVTIYLINCGVVWTVIGMFLYVDQEVRMATFRKRVRSSFFKDVFLWPFIVNPLRWPGYFLTFLLYPVFYRVRMQVDGCFARPPLEPSPWLAPTKDDAPDAPCSDSTLLTALEKHPGAWTSR